MGKFDKDRFQKELAVRYCLARGMVPFLEVVVPSTADLSDSVEVLTDIDVLGVESVADGSLSRSIFDCKTTSKLSAINRAFWASGLLRYTGCDYAFVILKNRAVHNHRMSALSIGVDLHTEVSFTDLGRSVDPAFPHNDSYQVSIDRWNGIYDIYVKNSWSERLYNVGRNVAPLSKAPWSTFRRAIAELGEAKGYLDPAKDEHIAIYLDFLSSNLVLWSSIARDIRRFYDPAMTKAEFERVLRYYIWGGKESLQIRQKMREKLSPSEAGAPIVELPDWERLVAFAGLVVSSPQSIFSCAHVCRELAFRLVGAPLPAADAFLKTAASANSRIKQFPVGLSDYFVSACGVPKELGKRVQGIIFGI